jgi:hypothetical protein
MRGRRISHAFDLIAGKEVYLREPSKVILSFALVKVGCILWPMSSDAPLPAATGYTTVQPSGGPYKYTPIMEGFICSGIWAILSAALFVGLQLWTEHFHPDNDTLSSVNWAGVVGTLTGQFFVLAICLSSVVFFRRRKNVRSFILLDWRWWLVCLILSINPQKPVLAWLWVGLIYQGRLSMKQKFPPSALLF